ncbi:MAG: DnaA ATPase domain-containing protein [Candidatus Hydrogenedentota bacterium]
MAAFTFDTFEVSDANREAYEACRAVAALRYHGDLPVLLLGAQHSGKSHLLWSIVREVRAAGGQTDLVLVLAREFPEKVRRLREDPRPIQRSAPALLLVDELERFDQFAADLEGVVRVFLENGHTVVVASHVHPARIAKLTRGFRSLLRRGRVIELAPVRVQTPAEDAAAIERLQDQNQMLMRMLKQVRADAQTAQEEKARVTAEAARLREERRVFQERLAQAAEHAETRDELRQRAENAQTEAEVARSEQARLAEEAQSLRVELAAQEARAETAMQRALAEFEERYTDMSRDRGALSAVAEDQPPIEETVSHLRAELDAARQEAETARARQDHLEAELSVLRRQAEKDTPFASEAAAPPAHVTARIDVLCARITDQHAQFMDEEKACFEALDHLDQVLARWSGECVPGDADGTAPDTPAQPVLTGVPGGAPVRRDGALTATLMDEARREQGRLRGALEAARGRLYGLQHELDHLRRQQAAESGGLAARPTETAAVHVEAGELEHRIARLEAVLGRSVYADSNEERGIALGGGDLAGTVYHLRILSERLYALQQASQSLFAIEATDQPALFSHDTPPPHTQPTEPPPE